MNNKIYDINLKTNKVVNNMSNNIPFNFSQQEQTYKEYCTSISKTDFANSPRRYIIENTFVKDLLKSAKEYKLPSKEEYYLKKADEIATKLKEFGIEIS